jgi:hypothetical protein
MEGGPRPDKSRLQCQNEYCERPQGHSKDECLSYGGGKAGQYWEGYKGPRDIHLHPDVRRRMRRERELARQPPTKPKTLPRRNVANIADTYQPEESRSSNQDLETSDTPEQISVAIPNKEELLLLVDAHEEVICATQALKSDTPHDPRIYHDTGAT